MKNKILLLVLATFLVFAGLPKNTNADNNFHIVKDGETLNTISSNYNISLNDIILHNKQILNTNIITPNELVNIPSEDNNTFGVIYKAISDKNSDDEVYPVSSFNYENATTNTSDTEKELLSLINETRSLYDRTDLTYDESLSLLAKNECDSLLNKDIKKMQSSKDLPKKLTFYNTKYKYAGQLSLMGQKNTADIINILNDYALYDYVINPDYTKVGLYVFETDSNLYTSLYFVC